MKRKFLYPFFFLVFLGKSFLLTAQVSDKGMFIGTSFFVSNGIDMTLPGSLTVNLTNDFRNAGKVYFKNPTGSYLVLPPGDLGTGEFIFEGSANTELRENGNENESPIQLVNLRMDMAAGLLSLKGNLFLTGVLSLKSGIIHLGENGSLLIGNSSPDAILFNDSPLNSSYIDGYLSRKIAVGKRYVYPVGNSDFYHPFVVDKPAKEDVISVSFDNNVPNEIANNDPDQTIAMGLIKSYGWRVEADLNQSNKFYSGLSLYNTPLADNANLLEVYHFLEDDIRGTIVPGKLDASFLTGNELQTSGLYAFSQSINTDKFLNFIYVDGHNKTSFEIPNIDDYSNITLKLYNHLGSVLYKSDHYANDLDLKGFAGGTYFYEMVFEKEGKQSIVRKFIEIVHEK